MARATFGGLCVLLPLALLVPACKSQNSQPDPDAPKTAVHSYTVRGVVVSLPSENDAEAVIRHEAIPEYRRPDGTLGMDVMAMRFPLAESVDLEGIDAADKVTFTFEVTVEQETLMPRGYELVSITELPVDTELDFSGL